MPLQRDIEAALGQPVTLANDANCLALSEATDGAGGRRGGGLCRHPGHRRGRRHRRARPGAARAAPAGGRVGAQPAPLGRADARPGLSTATAASVAASKDAGQRHGAGARPCAPSTPRSRPAKTSCRRAAAGDAACRATLDRHARRLAQALAAVINLLDPDVIVLGGGLSRLAHLYEQVPALWSRWASAPTAPSRAHELAAGAARRRFRRARRGLDPRAEPITRRGARIGLRVVAVRGPHPHPRPRAGAGTSRSGVLGDQRLGRCPAMPRP